MKKTFLSICLLVGLMITSSLGLANAPKPEYYQLRIYQCKTKDQQAVVEHYLQTAFIPAMHRTGVKTLGVFMPIGNDTAATRQVFVLIPLSSLQDLTKTARELEKDDLYKADGKDFLQAPYDNPPFQRMESIILQAFSGMPQLEVPKLSTPHSDRIYELRSYEGPTESLYRNKVEMFNKGDEVGLFKRLGFNAVFYAEVLSGSHMPNLMYMTTFENMASHDQHWKSFVDDPYWKKLSAMPGYQHNVSKADIFLLRPADYSDL